MQPCSQPWYGLIDCVNGMSGESLRAMIVRDAWIITVVLSGGSGSSSATAFSQPSSTASRPSLRNRFAGLNVAPLPLGGSGPLFTALSSRSSDQRGVERDRRVQNARDRAIGLGVVGRFREFRRIDLRNTRARR